MSKRVLVTGGCGFISSNFIRHLLAHTDHQVVSLDALTYAGNLENLADAPVPRLAMAWRLVGPGLPCSTPTGRDGDRAKRNRA